ncbi:MAG TPA: response regulator [Polyangia bacterium]|nr:response regulator [Polyangia bacterium]
MSEQRVCKTVLVVDDDQAIRESIVQVLEDEGYRGVQARDGLDALHNLRAAANAPCVILLDLMMPVMDGVQFRDQQLRDPRLASIPVIVISADSAVLGKAKSLRPEAVLRKPIELAHLLATVEQYC